MGYNAEWILLCTILVQQQLSLLKELMRMPKLVTVQLQPSSPTDETISVKTQFKYFHCSSVFFYEFMLK